VTTHSIFRLDRIEGAARLPYSLKVLLESLLRNEDGVTVTADQVRAVAGLDPTAEHGSEMQYTRPECFCRTSPASRASPILYQDDGHQTFLALLSNMCLSIDKRI